MGTSSSVHHGFIRGAIALHSRDSSEQHRSRVSDPTAVPCPYEDESKHEESGRPPTLWGTMLSLPSPQLEQEQGRSALPARPRPLGLPQWGPPNPTPNFPARPRRRRSEERKWEARHSDSTLLTISTSWESAGWSSERDLPTSEYSYSTSTASVPHGRHHHVPHVNSRTQSYHLNWHASHYVNCRAQPQMNSQAHHRMNLCVLSAEDVQRPCLTSDTKR